MRCHLCEQDLQSVSVGDLVVWTCSGGCAAHWFEPAESGKIAAGLFGAGAALLETPRRAGLQIDPAIRRYCPSCPDTVMVHQFHDRSGGIQVDACPVCEGFLLNPGDLAEGLRAADPARSAMAAHVQDEVFANQLHVMQQRSANKAQKARTIARILRFICPADLQPKAQSWEEGA